MKQILTLLILALAINASAQQTPKTYTGPFRIGNNEGTATYTYFEKDGERVIDGNFSFNCQTENITIIGKYAKGKKTGLWTRKQIYSRYNGMAVVKADLKWPKVTENTPFKEITEVTTENYLNDKLEGAWTQTKTVKNSWGYPTPGGTSSFDFIVKKTFLADEMTSIEGTRKKNGVSNVSLKGSYKKKLADGNWLFNDNKNTYSYNFINGYLTNYEIKELGTGKVISSNKIEIDNELINSYFTKSDNNFEIEYGQFYSELRDAKISIQKVNENLSIIKLCRLKKEAAKFVNLDVRFFSNVFGEDITPYKNDDYNEFAYSPSITCEVLNESNYRLLDNVYFKDIKSEFAFLNLTTNSKGQFLNTEWENWIKVNKSSDSRYFFQLKSYLYKGDTTGLKAFRELFKNFYLSIATEPIPNGKFVNIGKSESEFNDYLKFLTSLSLGETENWKAFINKKFNSSAFEKSWQSVILNQLLELQSSTSFVKDNINEAISYVKSKDDEVKQMNNEAISNIKEFKLGNQVWMASDLNIIPSHQSYQLVIDNKIQDIKVGKGIILYGINNDNKSLCPNGWRIPTTSDWETVIKTLGGDKNAAGNLLLVGKGSGFETTFPIILYNDNSRELFYSSGSPGGYLALDKEGNIAAYGFGYDYQLRYYQSKSFVPCRCIKE
jgi:uncharacterized protein (TIGR02145 family)